MKAPKFNQKVQVVLLEHSHVPSIAKITPTQYRFNPKNTRSTPPTKLEHQNPQTHNVSTHEFNQNGKNLDRTDPIPKNKYNQKWTSGIVMAATPSCGGLRFPASAHRWAWSLAWRSWSAPWLWRIGYGVEREREGERELANKQERRTLALTMLYDVSWEECLPWLLLPFSLEWYWPWKGKGRGGDLARNMLLMTHGTLLPHSHPPSNHLAGWLWKVLRSREAGGNQLGELSVKTLRIS